MSKIFLLLGGNKLNYGIAEKFHNKEYLIYVIDWNVCPQIVGDRHYQIDVKDPISIIKILKKDKVWDDVAFAYSSIDLAVSSVAYINREIGLHTLSDAALLYSSSKSRMVERWKELKLLNRYSLKSDSYSLELYNLVQSMKVIVKPDNSASSRGITILPKGSSKKECEEAYQKAREEATNAIVVIEEFVEGTEFTVELLGDSYGNVCVYAISKKAHTDNTDHNRIAVKLHYNAVSNKLQEKIAAYGIACYKALDVTSSLGHLEVIVKEDGTISPVEMGARSSGFIASDLVDIVSGADYLQDLIDVYIGGRVINGLHPQSEKSAVYFFYDFPDKSIVKKENNLMEYMDRSVKSRYHDRSNIKMNYQFSKIDNDNARQGFEIIEGPKEILTTEYLKERERIMIEETVEFPHSTSRNIELYTETYIEAPFTKQNAEYRRRCVLSQIKKYKHDRILEIGCGLYPLFLYMDPTEYETYTIVEPGRIFVDKAQREINKRNLDGKVMIREGCFEKMDISGDYDFIICSSLLHEVDSSVSLLERMYLVATSETVLHINVPNAYSLHRLIAKEAGMLRDVHELSERNRNLQQREVYDLESLKAEVTSTGFYVLEEGSYFIKPFTHKQMADMLEKNVIGENVLEGLWGLGTYLPQYGSEIYLNIKKG